MQIESILDPRIYPIGKFVRPATITQEMITQTLARIAALPGLVSEVALQLDTNHLSMSYRENGWTARQVIHHLADSHANMYIRLKLALTEENPTIKPYDQDAWADLGEARNGNVAVSLMLLEALHHRITATLNEMDPSAFDRTYFHPEQSRAVSLAEVVLMYAWHGEHHLGHLQVIATLRSY